MHPAEPSILQKGIVGTVDVQILFCCNFGDQSFMEGSYGQYSDVGIASERFGFSISASDH